MTQYLFVVFIYLVFIAFLLRVFRQHLIRIKDMLAFTAIFWASYFLLRSENLLGEIAAFFGFQVASNMIFVGILAVFGLYLIKLNLKTVKLERKLRTVVYSIEIEKIRKIL
jgi:hypothetical protein